MVKTTLPNDLFKLYMSEITSRVVAESGIPTDRYHLGKLILQCLKDAPDFVAQIDAGTGESETNRSMLERSVQCAISLQGEGLKTGDVIVIMAPNHLDSVIPFYAALYLGVAVSPVDGTFKSKELMYTFANSMPKLVFCHSEKSLDVQLALNELQLQCQIITFDKDDQFCSFSNFLKRYNSETIIDKFVVNNFNAEDTIACLVSTSGTTGLPKKTASTHKNFAIAGPYLWAKHTNFPTPTKSSFICATMQWLSAIVHIIVCPIFRVTRVQSSLTLTKDHSYYVINTYKPTYIALTPLTMMSLVKSEDTGTCDFSNFETILIGGCAVSRNLIEEVKNVAKNADVYIVFGMSELSSIAFHSFGTNYSAVGQLIGCLQYRLIDIKTQQDITEPNTPGELWLKGPNIIKEYYRNPEVTAEAFAEGHWFKTGDVFYRDENFMFFYVNRIKLIIKYRGYQISPVEIETVIRRHPGILDVAVTSVPDEECGDLPVACVVLKPRFEVPAQEIKDLVKDNLSDAKQLRGGVIYLDKIPATTTMKVNRKKLKEIALKFNKE